MTTAYTSLLGLALPVTGELSGTWGDVVNAEITSLLDSSVAGTTTLSTDADVTLTTTTGASNQARQAVLLCTGARTAMRTITAPARSKSYIIINATTGGFDVKLVGVGPTTGVTVPAGTRALISWNSSDFVKVSSWPVALTTDVSGTLPVANGGTGVTSSTGSGSVVLSTSPTLTTPNLGTPSALVLTNATGTPTSIGLANGTGLPLTTGVTGTLPVTNGGTGQTTYTDGQLLIGNTTGNTLTKATLTAGTGVSITNGSGAITINATGTGGTVTSVSVVSANGLAGTVATETTTPAITLSTSITGVLKGNGTAISAAVAGTDYVTPTGAETLTNKSLTGPVITGTKEIRVAMGANNIDLATGNYFTKTISGATTLTVSNTPASGTAESFIFDVTNGGSAVITWWSGTKWAGGIAPTLSASGRDILGFFTYDGGTTWNGLVLGKAMA